MSKGLCGGGSSGVGGPGNKRAYDMGKRAMLKRMLVRVLSLFRLSALDL